jgi:hypothetical protein
MAIKDKDTVYIDIDDEITGIIDKLKGSDGKVVALVLPKRASAFQSIVNMKLLKRAADSSKKNMVLITSEAGLLPLAGAAGVHVAKTLTSKPEIPLAPKADDDREETVQEEEGEPADPLADPSKSIGELAGGSAAASAVKPAADGVETLTLDDEDLPPEAAATAKAGSKSFEPPKGKKNKKLRIPNFERFRLWLIIGGAVLVLIIAILLFITFSLPKATITIKTDATSVSTNLNLNLSPTAQSLDTVNSIVPAKLASEQKTYTQQVTTTGQKNTGNKASGTVTMSGQTCGTIPNGNPDDVPAGTGLSANGQTYITQQDTSFSYNGPPKKGCLQFQAAGPTPITAQSAGASFNIPNGTSFSVAGRSDISSSGSASGGTDNIVQTVNQNDINNAKNKISTADDAQIKQTLEDQLKGGNYYAIIATYNAGTPSVTSSANVGDVATSVTVTETVTYGMFGVHQSDLNTLIDKQVNTQIDTSKQSVLDSGLANAVFNVNTIAASGAQLTMSTNATAGPHLDVNTIKRQAAGQREGAIKSQLSGNPDVTSVNVTISPFWVSTAPKKTSRITVTIAKPATNVKASNSSGSNP